MLLRMIAAAFAALFLANMIPSGADELHLSFRQFPAKIHAGNTVEPPRWLERRIPISDYVAARVGSEIVDDYFDRAANPRWHFGGRYFLYTTGCGTACQTGVLFHRVTGEVMAQLPVATSGYEYRRDSNLLVVNPTNEEILRSRHMFREEVTYYYVWTGRSFKLIAQEAWPD